MLIVHVASHEHAPVHLEEIEAFRDLLRDEVRDRVAVVSYEKMIPVLADHGLAELALDVKRRVATAK